MENLRNRYLEGDGEALVAMVELIAALGFSIRRVGFTEVVIKATTDGNVPGFVAEVTTEMDYAGYPKWRIRASR